MHGFDGSFDTQADYTQRDDDFISGVFHCVGRDVACGHISLVSCWRLHQRTLPGTALPATPQIREVSAFSAATAKSVAFETIRWTRHDPTLILPRSVLSDLYTNCGVMRS